MNYADDRRDRLARDGLDAENVSLSNDHSHVATVLRDLGRNRAALCHYGVAWLRDPTSAQAAGDYAQMAALAGFPQVGLVALLVYRRILRLVGGSEQKNNEKVEADAIRQLLRTEMVANTDQKDSNGNGDSGCRGQAGCAVWMIPMTDAAIEQVLNCIDVYCHHRVVALHYRRQQQKESGNASGAAAVPTAHKLIKLLTDGETVVCDDHNDDARPPIPALLQFWTTVAKDDDDDRDTELLPLPPVLQLLLVKLLFEVLPSLAIEAVVYLRFDNDDDDDEKISGSGKKELLSVAMARYYKLHWAYFVFIKSLVLGERIKPHRRRLQTYHHVPLWDRLWGLDDDDDDVINNNEETDVSALANHYGVRDRGEEAPPSKQFVANLRRFFRALKAESNDKVDNVFPSWQSVSLPPFRRAANEKPIFLVGDSHVFSLAWNTIRVLGGRRRLVVPVVVTGLKAWHVRSSTRFFTRSCLENVLPRIDATTILFSAGEIDCREGLGGPLLQGYTQKTQCGNTSKRCTSSWRSIPTACRRYWSFLLLRICFGPKDALRRKFRDERRCESGTMSCASCFPIETVCSCWTMRTKCKILDTVLSMLSTQCSTRIRHT